MSPEWTAVFLAAHVIAWLINGRNWGAAFRAPVAVSIPAIAGLLLYCTILDGYMMVPQILLAMVTVVGNYIFGLMILKIIVGKKSEKESAA